jgi:hypothetical protein
LTFGAGRETLAPERAAQPARAGSRRGREKVMTRRLLAVAFVAALAFSATAAAAKPVQFRVSLDDPELEADLVADLTAACGAPIAADTNGFVLVKLFDRKGGGGPLEINVFHLTATFRNLATGATAALLDVGPDRVTLDRNGNVIVTIIGRSLTGSGVIGRVVIDAATGTVLSSSGHAVGDWVANACAELT